MNHLRSTLTRGISMQKAQRELHEPPTVLNGGIMVCKPCFYAIIQPFGRFCLGIERDIQKQKTILLQGTAGVEHVAREKYRGLNGRMRRSVDAYMAVLECLFIYARLHICLTHKNISIAFIILVLKHMYYSISLESVIVFNRYWLCPRGQQTRG